MKNKRFFSGFYFAKHGLVLIFFFVITSCQKENGIDTHELLADPLELKGVLPPTATESRCNCEYQVVSLNYTPSTPSGFEIGYGFSSDEMCSNNENCRLFQFSEYCDYFNDNCTNFPGGDPIPGDILTKPTAWYSFFCQPLFYSEINPKAENVLFFNEYCLVDNVNNPKPEGEIGIKIRCKGASTGTTCNPELWHTTTTIYLPFKNGYTTTPWASIDLTECGCTPSVSYVQ